MMTWLAQNWINIALIAGITAIVALVIRSMIRGKKAGKPSCGCSCGGCAGCSLNGASCSADKQ